jgi:DNA-binding CsgD family transcriptional regulator
MTTGLNGLTAKEKDALRLLLRGHDAKSSARELGLSVHTVNERLRDARRKLGVTSSREAARLLLAEEREKTPEIFADKALRDAAEAPVAANMTAPATRRWAWFGLGPGLAHALIGVLAMSLILAALLAVWSPSMSESSEDLPAVPVNLDKVQVAARAWLALIDRGEWQASHTASGSAFRSAIPASAWGQAAARARQPLGRVVKRELLEYGSQSAPRETRIVLFRTDFANRTGTTETVTLERDGGEYRVVGYWIK